MHDFLNAVLFLAGVFKLTVSFLFAGDVLTAFDEINHDVLAHSQLHKGLSTGTTAAVMREGVRVRACANLPGAGSTSLIPVSRGWGQGEVETPNLFRWLFDDVFEGVNLGVEVFWVCGIR